MVVVKLRGCGSVINLQIQNTSLQQMMTKPSEMDVDRGAKSEIGLDEMDNQVGWGIKHLYGANKIWGKKWNMYWIDETYVQVPREAFKEQRCCEKVPEGQVGERLGEDETAWIGKNGDDLEDGVI